VVKAVFDTNILIDFLNGHEQARREVRRYPEKAVSILTWIEVMAGATDKTEDACRALLGVFERLDLTPPVAKRAVLLRRQSRIKLPDAIILATAQMASSTLITRTTRDFPAAALGIHVPYKL
jgi:predicted nucleic acid-binding protein